MKTMRALNFAILAAVLSACGATAGTEMKPASNLEEVTKAARADAAKRLGAATPLKVLSAEQVVWGNTALGCATKPGVSSMERLTPGYRVRLQAGSVVLDYHADERGTLVLCPSDAGGEPRADPRV